MKKAGIKPVHLAPKEGIALNNGTQLMTALAALTINDAENLVKTAETALALTLEGLLGVSDAFDEKIHRVRPHKGQSATAHNVRELTKGSRLLQTGTEALTKTRYLHDPYSLRCAPQVLGAARDAIDYVKRIVSVEMNSATDNPLVFPEEEECLSGGNFHGQPISIALDLLGMAIAIIGNMSERRTARLLDAKLNNELPPFLVPQEAKTGLNSGLMTAQYTAAALVSENKTLTHPACVDSIPTSANFEDFVSMGTTAAHKTAQVLENTEYIVAIELLCACQAVDFRGPEKLGKGTRIAHTIVRQNVPRFVEDRVPSGEIEKTRQLIKSGTLISRIDETVEML
jgi:histidine ammonia-lyase